MKLSIAWIFDHIVADWKSIDIPALSAQFNQITAEIEGFEKITVDLQPFSLAQLREISADNVAVFSPEWDTTISLSMRKDALANAWYIVKKGPKGVSWATLQDLKSGKEGLMPAVHVAESRRAGGWKKSFETEDYIIELDNKSVTNRPDMWGHRGFAREVAVILNLPLKNEREFLANYPVHEYQNTVPVTASNPIEIKVEASQACKRFAGMYVSNVHNQPSHLWMAHRLARIDAKPIDMIVDATNYVMYDLGQPMHAFDADKIVTQKLIPRMAKNQERITLLDGETVELTDQDLVISDGPTPLALAGVMGGRDSGINQNTHAVLIESACFDAATVRKTSARYRKRSEASARFEKSLDPNQNVAAIQRFLKLMQDAHVPCTPSGEIFSLGAQAQESVIEITHDFIEKRLGNPIEGSFIIALLEKLEFKVLVGEHGTYAITVPTFRGTKDIKIKEDIIEEIGRFVGYTTMHAQLPSLQIAPHDLHWVYQRRMIKQLLAHTLQMRELYTYAFFDEEFLANVLKWQPGKTLEVQSPVSENWRRLATTLMPNLFKAVVSSSAENDELAFFELGRTWQSEDKTVERKTLAGIHYNQKKPIDFYDIKSQLMILFDALKLSVEWQKVENPEFPWYMPYQTANIIHQGINIGVVGKVHPATMQQLCHGDAFIFELDADFLLAYKPALKRFIAPSKYPEIVRDISMLIPIQESVAIIRDLIASVNSKITAVLLLDFIEKEEWPHQRALTFRFVVSDKEKTMTKEEADGIWDSVANALKSMGAVIR